MPYDPKDTESYQQHPMQDIYLDATKVARFRGNKIVQFLYETSQNKMNELAAMPFSNEDREQFAQLIGYSVTGFSELSYASNDVVNEAAAIADEMMGIGS